MQCGASGPGGCTEGHVFHHCRKCGDRNSNHRARDCKKSTRPRGNKCKARNCTEAHSSHFCKVCASSDSDHRARDCPSSTLVTFPPPVPVRCNASGCTENHAVHFCKFCGGSNHRARYCFRNPNKNRKMCRNNCGGKNGLHPCENCL